MPFLPEHAVEKLKMYLDWKNHGKIAEHSEQQ